MAVRMQRHAEGVFEYLASSRTGIHMRALVLHAPMSAGGSAIRAANLSGRSSCQTKTLSDKGPFDA